MDKDAAWSIFESTGNIDAYLLYHDLIGGDEPETEIGQEGNLRADQYRRGGTQKFERR